MFFFQLEVKHTVSKLKVGIVGCGFIAKKRHIPAFLRLRNNVILEAICDLKKSLAESVAEEFGVPRAYSSLSEMLTKEDLELIDVCTQPHIHAPLAIEAMKSGCHVLLEKPMALKVSDCDQMMKFASENEVKLCVVHNEIFSPVFLKARKLVDSGTIGELTGIRWFRLTPRSEYMTLKDHWVHKLPGGVLGETGPHAIYTSLVFLKNVKNVYCYARKFSTDSWVMYDDYRIGLEAENGNSSIVISHANDCAAAECDLIGTKGIIKLDLQSMLLVLYKRDDLKLKTLAFSSLSVGGQIVKNVLLNTFSFVFSNPKLGHDLLIEKFVKSILNNEPAPVTMEEGRETVKLMEMLVNELGQHKTKSKSH